MLLPPRLKISPRRASAQGKIQEGLTYSAAPMNLLWAPGDLPKDTLKKNNKQNSQELPDSQVLGLGIVYGTV